MEQRAFIFINPVAGVSRPQDLRSAVERVLGQAGWELDFYQTTGEEDLPALVKTALAEHNPQLVVAAGGDGTISGVAAGLAGSGVPLGILPAGSWNSLARNLEIPGPHEEAARLWLGEHELLALDGIRVGGRIYFLNVGVGISTRLMSETPREHKRFIGGLAYFRTLAVELSGMSMRRYRVTIDGKITKVRAVEVIAVNAGLGGVGELRTHEVFHPGDGKIELCAIRAKTFGQGVMVILRFVAGQRGKKAGISYRRAEQSFTVQTTRRLPVQADGEIIGWTPLEGEVVPHAVNVIVKPGFMARMDARLQAQAEQGSISKWG
jgi:diacylglycerol kinase family enzyme